MVGTEFRVEQVAFVDDSPFGAGGTSVLVNGNGSVIYQGTTNYQGSVKVNNANFKVDGVIDQAPISICRDKSIGLQRGMLSGHGSVSGQVMVNSGIISPDIGETLTLGSLTLQSASPEYLGSLTHLEINSAGSSLVAVTGTATLAGILEINVDSTAQPGQYTLLTAAGGITGTFDSIVFTGETPNYTLSYLPVPKPI
jgi:hypothetical protein